MTLLIDTQCWLWWLTEPGRLRAPALSLLNDGATRILLSAASSWEIAIKYRIGKLDGVQELVSDIPGAIASQGFEELPITVDDAARAGLLPGRHRDPFDRMLVAQALSRNLPLVSIETVFDDYSVRRIW